MPAVAVVALVLALIRADQHCDGSGYCEDAPPERHDYSAREASRVPFVPFPAPPLAEPWKEGVDTGVSLVGGNGVTVPKKRNIGNVPTECPELVKPYNVHFMVINLDRSTNRRRKMRADFEAHGLPMFERVPGVIVTEDTVATMAPPRKSPALKLADYGCALAHRRAWERVADGPHEWVVVLEDDAELIDGVNLTDLPKVPVDADIVMFRSGTIMRWAPVCTETEVMRAYWGFGFVGYLLSREGARQMLAATAGGLSTPLDGSVWYTNAVYTTRKDYIWHPPCDNPCPSSVRTWLNGELPASESFPD